MFGLDRFRRGRGARYGLSEHDARHVADMFVLMERGLLASTTGDLAASLGREPLTFEDYVVRAAAVGAWRR